MAFTYPTAEEVSLASLESIALPRPGEAARKEVLTDISFRAEPGQLVALVGPSGAGKTTISQLVPRLYDVDEGAVEISGVDVRDATLDSLRATVGVVTQDAHMFHDTIRSNLLYAKPDATEAELREALAAAQILPFIEGLADGLDTIVGDRGYRLSGGEKQRIAIARLLLKAPDVVVLDEATAHLDSESEVALQTALKTALEGRTSLVIAHRLSTVRDADQILVIDERPRRGARHPRRTGAEGGPYAELYETQFRPGSGDNSDEAQRRGEVGSWRASRAVLVGLGTSRKTPGVPFYMSERDLAFARRRWLNLAYAPTSPAQRLDIFLPEEGEGPFPVIVHIHGGGFAAGHRRSYHTLACFRGLERGYAVAAIDYS